MSLVKNIIGDSNVTMAPQGKNELSTASIKLVSSIAAIKDLKPIWKNFKDADGHTPPVRLHWVKEW